MEYLLDQTKFFDTNYPILCKESGYYYNTSFSVCDFVEVTENNMKISIKAKEC